MAVEAVSKDLGCGVTGNSSGGQTPSKIPSSVMLGSDWQGVGGFSGVVGAELWDGVVGAG
ncbi:hypothetical protein E2C01_041086 [Portunus trituberculatus]|uniref:Uncharacterized protein n=1 Tax=Portunus trituberculatus TaxID=210409 RepID=A0A5B7FSK8_PORTR|nr:hypothetical protein [Portunus trituberculatus]